MKITPKTYASVYVKATHGKTKTEVAGLTAGLWQLVWRKKHWGWRRDIIKAIATEYQLQNNLLPVQLMSARELSAEELKKIQHSLEKSVGQKVEMECQVKPHLLAGIVITIKDKRLDASLKGRLDSLYRRLSGEVAA